MNQFWLGFERKTPYLQGRPEPPGITIVVFSAFVGGWARYRTETVSGPILDPILESIWALKSAYFFTGAVQDGFQAVLRRLGRPLEGGPKKGPKMDREKIGRKSKTGQPTTLRGGVQRPREGIKGWVNPFL